MADRRKDMRMTLRLHCFGESGHSYKAALALELAGLDWEPIHVDFFKGETRSDAVPKVRTGNDFRDRLRSHLGFCCAS